MRPALFDLVIYEDEAAKPARWGRDNDRRPGGVGRPDGLAAGSRRSFAWLTGRARRREAAGHAAVGAT